MGCFWNPTQLWWRWGQGVLNRVKEARELQESTQDCHFREINRVDTSTLFLSPCPFSSLTWHKLTTFQKKKNKMITASLFPDVLCYFSLLCSNFPFSSNMTDRLALQAWNTHTQKSGELCWVRVERWNMGLKGWKRSVGKTCGFTPDMWMKSAFPANIPSKYKICYWVSFWSGGEQCQKLNSNFFIFFVS